MAYIDAPSEDEATGAVAELYHYERNRVGYVPNFAGLFAHRPDVYTAWRGLIESITATADFRRFELATLAAARARRSSYCALAHGSVLAKQFYDPATVQGLPTGLDETDTAMMLFAEQVARDPTSITRADIERLRELGLRDDEIVDAVLSTAARCFFSTVLDALGAEPDSIFNELDPELRESLTVGRPIAQAP
jgi:uncharacterized peroxidase-related enzyme